MLAKDIREMSEGDINSRIADLERERFNLRLKARRVTGRRGLKAATATNRAKRSKRA